jgi:endonuclease/exonuclease/phosphatase family metal-dependent hydrolase
MKLRLRAATLIALALVGACRTGRNYPGGRDKRDAGVLNDATVARVAQEAGYAWPTRHGPRTTPFGRWDHVLLKGLRSRDSAAAGTGSAARGVSDHRPVWTVGILP